MNARSRPGQKMAAHGDDWLITYADTITLLLCLFVVLLSISAGKHHDHRPASHVDPVQGSVQGNVRPLNFTDNVEPTASQAPDEDEDEGRLEQSHAKTIRFVSAAPPVAALPAAHPAVPLPALPAPSPLPAPSRPVEPQGQRVYSAQISSAAFFGPSSATLSALGAELLRDVAVTVNSPRLADYKITVEGHTDDRPIRSSHFPSNWELSTARAAAVVRFLLNAGVPATRLRAAGYADTFPLVPNHDVSGQPIPENQARNRRVVIRLEKVE